MRTAHLGHKKSKIQKGRLFLLSAFPWIRRLDLRAPLKFVLIISSLFSGGAIAASFPCDGSFYQVRASGTDAQIYAIDRSTTPWTITSPIHVFSSTVRALAYNKVDNYLYALDNLGGTTFTTTLYKVDSTGQLSGITLANKPANFSANAFTISSAGLGYAWDSNGRFFYTINLATGAMTALPTQSPNGTNLGDISWDASTSRIYGINNNSNPPSLVWINPTTGALTNVGSTGVAGGAFGSLFSDGVGNIFGYDNNGGFYSFNKTSGAGTLVSTSPSVSGSDGASCVPSTGSGSSISGKVFDDANGSITKQTGEPYTNAGGLMAYLVDAGGVIVYRSPVYFGDSYYGNGVYSFPGPASGNYTIRISATLNIAVGAVAPVASLPSGWVSTGENVDGAIETVGPLEIGINFSGSTLINRDFAIERLPETISPPTPALQLNPGGTNQVISPTLSGSDPEDASILSFKITQLATNGTLFYDGAPVTLNQILSNYDSTKLRVDPVDGAVTVSFQFASVDAAGKVDPTPATATIPFTIPPSVTLSAPDATVDSTPTITGVTNAGAGQVVTVLVTDSTGATQTLTAVVQSDGTFSVTPPVALASGSYSAVATVTNTLGFVGSGSDNGSVAVDLTILKTNGTNLVTSGGTTTYTIRVTNSSQASVTGAILKDTPLGLTLQSISCTGGNTCTAGSLPTIQQLLDGFALPTLAGGAFYEIVVTAVVDATGSP